MINTSGYLIFPYVTIYFKYLSIFSFVDPSTSKYQQETEFFESEGLSPIYAQPQNRLTDNSWQRYMIFKFTINYPTLMKTDVMGDENNKLDSHRVDTPFQEER